MGESGESIFKGSEEYLLDNKGRIVLPQYMRRAISPAARDTFNLTSGYYRCIAAYPIDQWEKFQNTLRKLNPFDPEHDRIITILSMYSKEVTLDAQNRILLPKVLIQYAGIESKVLVVGKLDHIEFWNPDEFARVYAFEQQEYQKIYAKVMGEIYSSSYGIRQVTGEI